MPLRPVFNAPPSALGSSTNTAPQASARSSISAREVFDPTSSSEVINNSTPSRSSSSDSAWTACTMPAFMSKTPGPVALPPLTANGRAARAPIGKTVSWCPTTSTRDVRPESGMDMRSRGAVDQRGVAAEPALDHIVHSPR